jgi:hypothetical protein
LKNYRYCHHLTANFWWTWFPDDRWGVPVDQRESTNSSSSYTRFLFVDDGRVRDADCYEKLRHLLGEGELKHIKYAYAINNDGLKQRFEEFHDQLRKKWETLGDQFKKDTWRKKSEALRREALLKRVQKLLNKPNALWNEEVAPSRFSLTSVYCKYFLFLFSREGFPPFQLSAESLTRMRGLSVTRALGSSGTLKAVSERGFISRTRSAWRHRNRKTLPLEESCWLLGWLLWATYSP